jgi:hypothetical protein
MNASISKLKGSACAVFCACVLASTGFAAGLRVDAPSGMPTGKTVTAQQLWQVFDSSLPKGVWVSPLEDAEYEVISAKWLKYDFLPALKLQMKQLRENGVAADGSAGNCNGFALICRLMFSLAAMQAHARGPATATVVVHQDQAFGGIPATKEGHCVAFVLTDEGPWIIEAQSGVTTQLSAYPNLGSIQLVSVH